MDKTKFIIGVTVLLLASGVGVFVVSQPKNSDEAIRQEGLFLQKEFEKLEDKNAAGKNLNTNRYIPFSSTVLQEAKDKRRVLYFYANWCPTCRPADANFVKNQTQIPEDVAVIRVNYNDTDTDSSEKELAQQYGITYQHTFVQIDANGAEITKWNGGDIEKLVATIQ